MELLDNLPHDKLSRCPHDASTILQAELHTTNPNTNTNTPNNNNDLEERFV